MNSLCLMHAGVRPSSSELLVPYIERLASIRQNSHGRNALYNARPFHLESLPYIRISPKLTTSTQYSALISLLLLICLTLSMINRLPSYSSTITNGCSISGCSIRIHERVLPPCPKLFSLLSPTRSLFNYLLGWRLPRTIDKINEGSFVPQPFTE